jgi:hypothetical protein
VKPGQRVIEFPAWNVTLAVPPTVKEAPRLFLIRHTSVLLNAAIHATIVIRLTSRYDDQSPAPINWFR